MLNVQHWQKHPSARMSMLDFSIGNQLTFTIKAIDNKYQPEAPARKTRASLARRVSIKGKLRISRRPK
jgi:hypothetical protein